jgi:hypothetical protein
MNDISVQPSQLRHGLTCLHPSEVAEQYYCEYKVHLNRLHPEVRIESRPLELGEAQHAVLASQAELVTAAEVERAIRTGKKLALSEWVLEGTFQGVRVLGRTDFFTFEGKKALLLLDFKFSRAKTPFRNQEVQAELYALLAGSMDFSTEELCFGIVLFPSAGLGGAFHEAVAMKAAMLRSLNESGTLDKIAERCEQARKTLVCGRNKTATVDGEGWKAFLHRYDASKAARDLNWALGYWRSDREPIPVKRTPNKCSACPFNAAGLCEHALQKPDPRFKVQRRPDGQTFVYRD